MTYQSMVYGFAFLPAVPDPVSARTAAVAGKGPAGSRLSVLLVAQRETDHISSRNDGLRTLHRDLAGMAAV